MSGYLLDSHAFVWLVEDSPRLGKATRERIASGEAVFVSAATTWELAIKTKAGKFVMSVDITEGMVRAGLDDLSVSRAHSLAVVDVELPHRDPFDALLAAQARVEGLTLVTADEKLLSAVEGAVDARL